jgi:hypothetical protein
LPRFASETPVKRFAFDHGLWPAMNNQIGSITPGQRQ